MSTCPRCRTHYEDVEGRRTCTADGATLLPDAVFGASEAVLPPGTAAGEYVLEHLLGVGGFGAVYQAVQPLIGKSVAVKVLNFACSANPQVVSRFIAEARAVNQIQHRHIIDIFGFGQLPDGRHYYVMELLQGQPLDVWLAERPPLTLVEALPILRPLARALDAAHAKGIAHRDLKPENVFLVPDPGAEVEGALFPKLLDFGIAKLLAPEAREGVDHRTHTGAPIGTPTYMSPEQCKGRGVDHRTDIYSFGVMLFRMLTGRLPFTGLGFMEIAFRQMSEAPPRPSSLLPLPAGLDERILWFMEKDPELRPPTLAAGLRALEDLAAPLDSFRNLAPPAGSLPTVSAFGSTSPPVVRASDVGTAPTLAPLTSTPSFVGEVPTSAGLSASNGPAVAPVPPPAPRSGRKLSMLGAGALLVAAGVAFIVLRAPEKADVPQVTPAAAAAGTPPTLAPPSHGPTAPPASPTAAPTSPPTATVATPPDAGHPASEAKPGRAPSTGAPRKKPGKDDIESF